MKTYDGSKETISWREADAFLYACEEPANVPEDLEEDKQRVIARFTGNSDMPHSALGRVAGFLVSMIEDMDYVPSVLDTTFNYQDIPFDLRLADSELDSLGRHRKVIRRSVLDNIYDYYKVNRENIVHKETITKAGNRESYTLYPASGALVFVEKGLWYDRERGGEPDEVSFRAYSSYDCDVRLIDVVARFEDSRLAEVAV